MLGYYGSTGISLTKYFHGPIQVPDVGLSISTCEGIDTLRSIKNAQEFSER